MKIVRYLLLSALTLTVLGTGCHHDIITPEFDYNL